MSDITSEDPAVGEGPLAGYRVVELGVWVAGPASGGLCADWGADVVKVEPPTGDPQRNVFGAVGIKDQRAVPPFESVNRGKRSVVIDLRTPEGRGQLDALLADADVFVTNLRPDALERLDLGNERVLADHPRLVYAAVTGYGDEGPDRDRPGYDIGAFYARSGLAHTLVPEGEHPPMMRSAVGDHLTGMALTSGLLAKLLERERTGRGGFVSTSLLRTGMYAMSWDVGIQLRFGRRERTRPRDENGTPLIHCYKAGDGRGFWLLCLEGDRHWPKLTAAIEAPELVDDERFDNAKGRRQNAPELISALDERFAQFSFDELTARFDEQDVWWAPINSIPDLIADPQARAGGGFVEMTPRDGDEPFEAVASPVDFGGYELRPGTVPELGEHTGDVFPSTS